MSAFTNLNDALRAMKTDPSTARDPIKRMFLCDGQFITANASIIEDRGNALHTRPSHDEIVLILGGEADFRVGDETNHLSAGDMISSRRTPCMDRSSRRVGGSRCYQFSLRSSTGLRRT